MSLRSFGIIAATLACGVQAPAFAQSITHGNCVVNARMVWVAMDRNGNETGRKSVLSDWFLDVSSAKKPGLFASSESKNQWSAMKTFKDKGYVLKPTIASDANLYRLPEPEMQMDITMFCQADSRYFCVAALTLNEFKRDAAGQVALSRIAAANTSRVVEGSSAGAALYASISASLAQLPGCALDR